MAARIWRWTKRLVVTLVVLAAVLLLLLWAAREVVLPAIIRSQVVQGLGDYWKGRVSVQEVRFRYFGPTDIVGIAFEDAQGRRWAHVDTLRVHLRDWPSLTPVLTELELGRVALDAHLVADEPLPLRTPDEPPDPAMQKYVDLQRIRLHELALTVGYGEELLDLEALRITVDREGEDYVLHAAPFRRARDRELDLVARIDPNSGRVQGTLRFDRPFREEDFQFVNAVLDGSIPLRTAQGRFAGEVRLAGLLSDPNTLALTAAGRLRDASVVLSDGLALDALSADLAYGDSAFRATAFRFQTLGGAVSGQAAVDLAADPIAYTGRAVATNIDLAAVRRTFELRELRGGSADANVTFHGDATGPLVVQGAGSADANLAVDPFRRARGPFTFRLVLATDPDEPSDPNLHVELTDWTVLTDGLGTVRGLDARLDYSAGQLRVPALSAQAFGGTVEGSGQVEIPPAYPRDPVRFRASVTATNIRTDALGGLVGGGDPLPLGAINARARIHGSVQETVELQASGEASIVLAGEPVRRFRGHYNLYAARLGHPEMAPELVLGLSDWTWRDNDVQVAQLQTARVEFEDDRLRIRDALLLTPGGSLQAGAAIRLTDAGPQYEGSFDAEGFDPLALTGGAGEGGGTEIRLDLQGRFRGTGSEQLTVETAGRAAAIVPGETPLRAAADLTATLSLTGLQQPDPLRRLSADVRLRDGVLQSQGAEPMLSSLQGTVTLAPGGQGRAQLRGEGAGGSFTADLRSAIPDGNALAYTGEVTLRDIDLARLPPQVGIPETLEQTRLSGQFALEGREFDALAVRGQGAAALRLKAEDLRDLRGRYELDLRVEGLSGPARPAVFGTGRFWEWEMANERGLIGRNLTAAVLAQGYSVDVSSVRGDLLRGRVRGLLRVDFDPNVPLVFRGGVWAADVDLPTAVEVFGDEGGQTRMTGLLDFAYRFAGRSFELQGVNGRGTIAIRDSEMGSVPVLTALLRAMSLDPASAARDTDVALSFSHEREVLTILDGRIATPVVAIAPRPGGTVNLDTQAIDVYVVTAVLEDIEGIIRLPFIELLSPLLQQVTQLHVTGYYGDAGELRITKEPLKDLGEGTIGFFRDAVLTGGGLGQGFLDALRSVLP